MSESTFRGIARECPECKGPSTVYTCGVGERVGERVFWRKRRCLNEACRARWLTKEVAIGALPRAAERPKA